MGVNINGVQSYGKFEPEYKASRLCNWEVPKWYPEHPCGNKGKTCVISNERGHLLPGVSRAPTNPWGDYVGTWHLPKKITRQQANALSAPPASKIAGWEKHCRKIKGRHQNEIQLEQPRVELKELVPVIDEISVVSEGKQSLDASVGKRSSDASVLEERPLCPIHDYD